MNVNLLHDGDVQVVDVEGKKVIMINVPRAVYSIRPVFINNNLLRVTYKRNHEGDYHCTEQKLPIEQIYSGGESKACNRRMQAMLRMIGYGENLGFGFPLILSAWNEKHWLKPKLIEQLELMQVKLILHIETFVKETVV